MADYSVVFATDDLLTDRGRMVRAMEAPRVLLLDGVHALAHGRPHIMAEFLERSVDNLTAATAKVPPTRDVPDECADLRDRVSGLRAALLDIVGQLTHAQSLVTTDRVGTLALADAAVLNLDAARITALAR